MNIIEHIVSTQQRMWHRRYRLAMHFFSRRWIALPYLVVKEVLKVMLIVVFARTHGIPQAFFYVLAISLAWDALEYFLAEREDHDDDDDGTPLLAKWVLAWVNVGRR